jgi:hypothetical protein
MSFNLIYFDYLSNFIFMKKKAQKNVLNRLTKSIQSKKNQHRNAPNQEVDSGKVNLK